MAQPQSKASVRFPLRLVLLVPFILVILLTVGIVWYVSFMNGQKAVNEVARQLRSDISARINDHLQKFLKTPHQTVLFNLASMQQGWLDANDTRLFQNYLLEQVKIHQSLTSIYYGNADGGIVGSGREGADGSLYVYNTADLQAGTFNKHAITSTGEMGDLLLSVPDFDARTRPWYIKADQSGTAVWSDIYILFTGQDMAISASSPVYDGQHQLLGVISVDIFLSQIEDFLQTLEISKSGESFIIEHSGLLVATSTGEKPFIETNGQMERLDAAHSQTPIVKAAAEFLRGRFGDNYQITREEQFDFEIDGNRYFLNVSPVKDPYGIDWLIVVVIPESDFMAEIIGTNFTTFFIITVALLISILLSAFMSQKITGRISHLNKATQAFIRSEGPDLFLGSSRISEIDELAESFTTMESQLHQTLADLHLEIDTRKQAEQRASHLANELQVTLDTVTVGISHVKNRRIDWANEAHDLMFGYAIGETRGMETSAFFTDWVDFNRLGQEAYARLAEGKIYSTEMEMHKKDGAPFWACLTGCAVNVDQPSEGFIWMIQDISERKKTDRLLQQIRQNYEVFFSSIDDFLFVLDEQGNMIHTNETVVNRLGYSPEELFGRSVLMVHPPERRDEAARIVAEMLAGTTEFCPVPLMTRSGSQIPVETRITSGFWNGKPAIFGVTKDMSQIILSEEKFSKAFHSNSVVMALSHFEDGTYIDVNEVFLKTFGYTRAEVIGKTSTGLDLFADPHQRSLVIEKLKHDRVIREIEVSVRAKDGSLRQGLFSADPIYIGKDECLLTVMVDITARKQAEEALAASESQHRALVEQVPAIVYTESADTRITLYISPQVEQLTGYTPEEWIADPGLWRAITHPEDLAALLAEDQHTTENHEPFQIEYRILTRGGRTLWIHDEAVVIKNQDGTPRFWQGVMYDITERKQTEEKLRLSEERYRLITENADDVIWVINMDRRLTFVSPSFERVLRYSHDELLQLQAEQLLMPESRANAMNAFNEEVATAQPKPASNYARILPMEYIRKDGSTVWIEMKFSFFRDADGHPTSVLGVGRNITERRRAEEALRESQSLYHSLVESSPLSICRKDQLGRFTFANRRFLELSHTTLADLVGKTDYDLHPSELAKKYRSDDQSVLNSGQVCELIEDRTMLGGETVVVQTIKTPIYDGTGRVNGIQIAFWDVTDRKRMEDALRLSQAMFQALFEFAPDAIVAAGQDGVITHVNAQVESLFGYRREELIGQNVEVLIPQSLMLQDIADRAGHAAEPKTRSLGAGFEFTGRRKDGSEVPLEISLGTLETASGPLILGTIRDITERRQAEFGLRLAKDELELANQKLEQALVREKQLSRIDALTGIYNRGYLFELAVRKFKTALRYQHPLSVILFDIDDFKHINDTYGHAVGDQTLQSITQAVLAQLRSADIFGRYGGDEFVILLPHTNSQEALTLADRIHAGLAAIHIKTTAGQFSVTISVGIAQIIHHGSQSDSVEDMFLRVDKAMYAAKRAGSGLTMLSDQG